MSSSSSVVHCSFCLASPTPDDMVYFLSTCFHISCAKCNERYFIKVKKNGVATTVCLDCKKEVVVQRINSKMKDRHLLQHPIKQLSEVCAQVDSLSFQSLPHPSTFKQDRKERDKILKAEETVFRAFNKAIDDATADRDEAMHLYTLFETALKMQSTPEEYKVYQQYLRGQSGSNAGNETVSQISFQPKPQMEFIESLDKANKGLDMGKITKLLKSQPKKGVLKSQTHTGDSSNSGNFTDDLGASKTRNDMECNISNYFEGPSSKKAKKS